MLDILRRLRDSLAALGARRLVALGLTGLTVFLLVGVSGYLLSRPQQEVLYSGLDPQDVTRMGAALQDAGVPFDVNSNGDSVLVAYGHAAKARMLLAEKGLPRSDSSGYELFDKLGSLGLTTFMQQVTKVRALEGELTKTIRLTDGIKAARVHLALRNEGSFRSSNDQATASVIVRAEGDAGERAAAAIRHLVAAAIPGLSPNDVTIMGADGRLLASSDDSVSAAPEKLIGLERGISSDIESRIARTLLPYVGAENFRVSVNAKLNADRRQTSETTFDPNSRVERSVRTIKESGEAQNAQGAAGVTVEQNIPVEQATNPAGDKSSEKKDRKEELTNYEINSRSVSTTSDGYGVDRLSVAVVLNRAMLVKDLGASPAPEAVTARIAELQKLVISAAGIVESRGDTVTITATDFLPEEAAAQEPPEGVLSWLANHSGSLINAGVLVLITLLVLLLGLRPALRIIVAERPALAGMNAAALPGMADPAGMPLADMSAGSAALDSFALPQLGGSETDPLLDSLAREVASSPKDRLAKIVELDPERAVEVLKQWLNEPEGRAA
ncbi:flagellar basal-body MS-ring/collar protein FliF [Aestuariivirga sp.]|uniref:flagellar basal-body MS-ring/collar protein FliF n=1 Tax=Aestuariivirga sp. TaxID=2650926 RepID=UPI0025B82AF9|nr:flagellar basal-body MS-ring/collar protein FliF [Aestuariivirga sp.]MCA3554246.1 flagellar M-ring protein FliF [Aestuariivirga sp.]